MNTEQTINDDNNENIPTVPKKVYIKMAHLNLPTTDNLEVWETYLTRKLTKNEKYLLYGYQSENYMNSMIANISEIADYKGLYIPKLSNLYGNCLFESIQHHNVCDDIPEFRNMLASFMYMFQDYPNIFPNQKSTMKELFDATNEIQFVYCKQDHTLYKYTYNIMCQDLSNNYNWARLPTQLILMLISMLFRLEIIILNNTSDWENIVLEYNKEDMYSTRKIYLGNLGETHYIPLDLKPDLDMQYNAIYYDDTYKKLMNWAIDLWKYEHQEWLYNYQQKKNVCIIFPSF